MARRDALGALPWLRLPAAPDLGLPGRDRGRLRFRPPGPQPPTLLERGVLARPAVRGELSGLAAVSRCARLPQAMVRGHPQPHRPALPGLRGAAPDRRRLRRSPLASP